MFFKEISKKLPIPQNVDIYVNIGYSELGGHSKTLTCCGGAWKYKGRETLIYTISLSLQCLPRQVLRMSTRQSKFSIIYFKGYGNQCQKSIYRLKNIFFY